MRKYRLVNNLIPGEIPLVVGTVSTEDMLSSANEYECDVVEVRLDLLGYNKIDWIDYSRKIESAGTPVLVTLRMTDDGGKWAGSDDKKKEILSDAIKNLSMIDIEYNSTLAGEMCAIAEKLGKPIVVSYHNFNGIGDMDKLDKIIAGMHKYPNAIAKVAVMVENKAEVAGLLKLLNKHKSQPVCIIGMGAEGTVTRQDFPVQGAALTYGYLDKLSAPGQLHVSRLVEYLRENHNEYNQYRNAKESGKL